MRSMHLAGACLLLSCVMPGYGQERVRESRRETTTTQVRKGTALVGARVTVEGTTSLGKVTDFIINEDGCIDFLVVGDEDEFVIVPWGVIRFNVEQRSVVVDTTITREKLRDVTF